MNREDIIKLAQECGHWSGQTVEMNDVGLERFAAFVAAHEREVCAKLCEALRDEDGYESWGTECAVAIRAMGDK